MNFELVTVAPFYYFLLCLLAAAGFTWLLYRRSNFESKALTRAMMALRFTGLFLLFVLLLSPVIRLRLQKEQKPTILIFKDQSRSIRSADSQALEKALVGLKDAWKEKFDIKILPFAEEVFQRTDSNANRSATRMSAAFDFTNEFFEGANVGAVVIASDGINNSGVNPLFKELHKKQPVFTIGLGDTAQYPDVWLSDVAANSTAFVDNEFTITANICGFGLKNSLVTLALFQDGIQIQKTTVSMTESNYFGTREFVVKPTSPGVKRYEVRIAGITGESNARNNAKSVFVKITDTKRKVAICYHATHPDVGALARSLEAFGQYDVVKLKSGTPFTTNQFDIFILHGFAANSNERDIVNEIVRQGKPIWFFLGGQSLPQFSSFEETGLRLQFTPGALGDVQGVVNAQFSEFLLDDALAGNIKTWPPAKVPNGRFQVPNMFRTFLFQKIGAVQTEYPLMGFTSASGKKQAWFFGEGIWRWRMRDIQQNGSSEVFDQWVAKTIQFITADEVKEKFRAFTNTPLVAVSENATVYAEYMDNTRQLSNKPAASLQLQGPGGLNKTMPFARTGLRYRADLGALPTGDYSYTARLASSPAEIATGRFAVTASDMELEETRANHTLLRQLAVKNRGAFYPIGGVEALGKRLSESKDIHAILFEETSATEFIHMKWLFALLIVVFGAEWFLRKREGSY